MDCLDVLELRIFAAILSLHAFHKMSRCQVVCADNGALLVRRSAEMTRSSQPSAVIPAESVTVSAGTAVSRSSNQPGLCYMSMFQKCVYPQLEILNALSSLKQ